ncbi:MAG: FAD-dependent oxidoreductase, partial [Lentisphaeria bacterium]|nr:FAD-dependent oxidoreductase [Lentisphaeria bacterium]
ERRDIDVHYQQILDPKTKPGTPDFLSKAIFRRVGQYEVPFRCLYSRNVPNLMMAGRCFSCTHVGLGGPRVMLTCGQMGIATGFAASLCTKYATDPRGVGRNHIAELRALVGVPESPPRPPPHLERTTHGTYFLQELPEPLRSLPRITITRGDSRQPAPGYAIALDQPATLYLAVHERGTCTLDKAWQATDLRIPWAPTHRDAVYRRDVPAGRVDIPGHDGRDGPHCGLPHVLFIEGHGGTPKVDLAGVPAELEARIATPPAADPAP